MASILRASLTLSPSRNWGSALKSQAVARPSHHHLLRRHPRLTTAIRNRVLSPPEQTGGQKFCGLISMLIHRLAHDKFRIGALPRMELLRSAVGDLGHVEIAFVIDSWLRAC